jgi:hypothetical protein
MRSLNYLLVAVFLAIAPVTEATSIKKCSELIARGLSLSEVFILFASSKLYEYGHLPKAQTATYRLIRVEAADAQSSREELQKLFETVLKDYKIKLDEWKSVESIELGKSELGSPDFSQKLQTLRVGKTRLTEEQAAVFKKLTAAAENARNRLKALLSASERTAFEETNKFLSEHDLLSLLRQFAKNPKLNLDFIGVADIAEWRYDLMTEAQAFRNSIQKKIMSALVDAANGASEIPESDERVLAMVAEKMRVTVEDLKPFFGASGIFENAHALVMATKEARPGSFVKVIDRRFFSEERKQNMLKAVREANEIVLFKMAENQDLKDFAAVKALAQSLNAPIIVAPAFAEIGLIPHKLDWLFEEPNVHFMVDRGIQLTRDFYIVDHGFEDKRDNPFIGLHKLYAPTDRVVQFHVRVRSETRATGIYDQRPGYFMSTGSMSDPAYFGKFRISMSTDERAQLEAEMNRSVTVLSRRYRSDKFGNLVGSANGIAPRRARYTESRYGYPAGLFDLGTIYSENGATEVKSLPAVILGDIHLGNTDPLFLKATLDALISLRLIEANPNFGKPMEMEYREGPVSLGALVFHDLVEGSPNNRHNMESLLTRAIEDARGALDFHDHFQSAAALVKQVTQLLPNTKVVVPIDNHGSDWLVKRLQEADLFKGSRPKEVPIILKLMLAAIEDKANPYERIFQHFGIDTDQVLFLDKGETFRAGIDLNNPTAFRMVHGVEVGQHSHMGKNGAKSISLAHLLTAYGANVTGHTHSSAEHGQSVKVGTGTPVRQGYHRGPANCDASIAVVYSDQAIQLLRMEKGSFIPKAPAQDAAEFFPGDEYPRMLIRKMPPGGPTTDQFRSDPPVNRHPR